MTSRYDVNHNSQRDVLRARQSSRCLMCVCVCVLSVFCTCYLTLTKSLNYMPDCLSPESTRGIRSTLI